MAFKLPLPSCHGRNDLDIITNFFESQNSVSKSLAMPAFFESTPEFYENGNPAESLEWSVDSPTPFHAFHVLPVQSQS